MQLHVHMKTMYTLGTQARKCKWAHHSTISPQPFPALQSQKQSSIICRKRRQYVQTGSLVCILLWHCAKLRPAAQRSTKYNNALKSTMCPCSILQNAPSDYTIANRMFYQVLLHTTRYDVFNIASKTTTTQHQHHFSVRCIKTLHCRQSTISTLQSASAPCDLERTL